MRLLASCAVVLAALAAGCGKGSSDEQQPAARVTAATAVATEQPFAHVLTAIGIVSPRPGRFAVLSAPGPTRVARIFVTPGQRVAAGDSLVEFERAPFDAAARSAAASLVSAERGYARAVRLVQAGILAQKDSEQAAADLAQAQAAAITARRAQELATLRAPLAGVVTRMTAVLGAAVDQSQPLVEVADPAALDIVLDVSPAEAAAIHAGDDVTVVTGEGGGAEALGQGVVTDVAAAVDSVSRAVTVRARLVRPARPLRIGEAVSGKIATAVHPRAVTVPVAALVPAGDGFQVFVVDSAGVAHARPVTVGGRSEALAEILTGLKAGETVVTTGAYGVEDGAKIERTVTR
ncbi:MAG TPA: efflux RND transporter periplasmic adaptor subunit [Gemmatimonadales bacterium]